jgi:hypothetical protein
LVRISFVEKSKFPGSETHETNQHTTSVPLDDDDNDNNNNNNNHHHDVAIMDMSHLSTNFFLTYSEISLMAFRSVSAFSVFLFASLRYIIMSTHTT